MNMTGADITLSGVCLQLTIVRVNARLLKMSKPRFTKFCACDDNSGVGLLLGSRKVKGQGDTRFDSVRMSDYSYNVTDRTLLTFTRWRDHMLLTRCSDSYWTLALFTYLLTHLLT